MKKMDINRFFVGELNFGFEINAFNGKDRFTDEQINKLDLYNSTILNGAVDITNSDYSLINSLGKREYKKVLSLFYKLDDRKYLCLHNQETYSRYNIDYCDNLMSLKSVLPKLGYDIGNGISFHKALSLFNQLLNHKIHYDNTKYDINKFYNGRIELFVDSVGYKNFYPYDKEYQPMNILDSILLENEYLSGGYVVVNPTNNREYHVNIYRSIFYLFSDGKMYSINTNRAYDNSDKDNQDYKIHVINSIKDELEKKNIDYSHDTISIPKILKLQKKMK